MKAEHRKELQTNSLADYLGRTVRNIRGGTGLSWTKVLLVLAAVLAVLAVLWYFRNRGRENAELWLKLDANTETKLQEIAKDYKDTKQGQAARFSLANLYLWHGIRMLGEPTKMFTGLDYVQQSMRFYKDLEEDLKDTKDDLDRLAEAKYGYAVATECLAVIDLKGLEGGKMLDDAKKLYEDLARGPLAKTAYGIMAQRRFDQLSNPAEYTAISTFYREFSAKTKLGRPQ